MATLLVDADIMVYKITSSTEEPTNWDGDLWTMHCDFAQAKKNISDTIDALVDKVKVDSVILCFSDKLNFRKDINLEYKLTRKKTRKPMCYVPALEFCKENYKYEIKPKLEADDVMGIMASGDDEYIIYSEDKDLLTGDTTDGYNGCPTIGPKRAEAILENLTPSEMWSAVVDTYKSRMFGENYALLQARMARILRDGEYINNEPVLWSPHVN